MSKVLYIKANPKRDSESNTFQIANVFVEEYKKNNPQDEIITLDLYKENIRPLDEKMLANMAAGVEDEVKKHALFFKECDKYIFAAPMWNLSIPSILKAYIDYIIYVGISFKYTPQGPVPLLSDKPRKAIHIVSRGGHYQEGLAKEYEMGDRYLRGIIGFIGVTDFKTIPFEMANVLTGEVLGKAKEETFKLATQLAKEF